jgi:DNA-binding NtrC family response regulator
MNVKKMLLADYNANDLLAMREIFIRSGFQVCTVDDGQSAYEHIIRDQYDLVVSEVILPHMNGIALLKKIRERNESLPVILISGNARVNEAVEAMKLGALDLS